MAATGAHKRDRAETISLRTTPTAPKDIQRSKLLYWRKRSCLPMMRIYWSFTGRRAAVVIETESDAFAA